MNILNALQNSLLFSKLKEEELKQVEAIVLLKKVKKNKSIFLENEEAKGFYLLISGSVKLCKSTVDGREMVLHFVRHFETFAEAALFANGKYPASAKTLLDSEVIYIPKDGFMELIKNNPEFTLT